MSGKLQDHHRQQLEQWIGTGPKDFDLLYSITRDGCNASTFHSKCDNRGPTVTVLYNTNSSVYGGYTSENWTSSGSYRNDSAAFLFQLQYNGSNIYNKFPITSAAYGNYGHSSYGPTFGSGHDLNTFSGTVISSGSYYQLNGGQNYGNAFNMRGVQANQINNGHYNVTDLEVYSVNVASQKKTILEEWRKTPDWTPELIENLMLEIESLKPVKEVSIPRFNILMTGPVGAGKSSFFNTYRNYEIRANASARPLNFTLSDTMGLEEGQGLDAHELTFILDGHVPNKYTFNPSKPFSPKTPGYISSPTNRQKIHCVCFIVDGSTVEVIPEKILEKMKGMRAHITHRDLPLVVLLTKVDRICSDVQKDLSSVFRSLKVKAAVDKASQLFGIPRAQVLPLKNYESETDIDNNISILTLLSLRQILRSCQDHMYDLLDNLSDDMSMLQAKE